jgi:hypothetical protein
MQIIIGVQKAVRVQKIRKKIKLETLVGNSGIKNSVFWR